MQGSSHISAGASHSPAYPAEPPGGPGIRRLRQVSLRGRIFVANAVVTAVAAAVLLLTPATVSSPVHLREISIVVGGLLAILVINLVLLSRALRPLDRLASMMRSVELLDPGRRIPVYGAEAEIVDLTRSFNEMLDRLEAERHSSIRRSLEAQESERGRVAQELHDEVGQSLTAVLLHLDRLARIAPDDLRVEITEARETARGSLEDVRSIAKRLRPEALDDLGLHSALVGLSERLTEQTGVKIRRDLSRQLPDISPECELVLYRVAQEAMTNALRHADATRVDLSLSSSAESVTLAVVDDGVGINGAEPGTGIQGMRERAVMVGAKISIGAADGEGTAVTLQVPARDRPA